MAVKKNDSKSAAEKVVKKEVAAPVKAVKEEKPEVKAEVKKADAKAEKAAQKKEEKKPAKAAKEDKPAKKAAPKKPAKKTVKADSEVYFEFAGKQISTAEVTKAVEAACKANGVKSADVKGVKVYVKAEDHAAYYVLANGESGKIDL